jgi:chaperone LolA
MTTRTALSSLLACLLLAAGAWLPAAAQSDTGLLEQVQARYESITDIQASFVQTIESDFSSTRRTTGTLYLAGARYRVETAQQTFVTDGETTWIYAPNQEQVVVNDAATDGSELTPETFFTDYADRYAVAASRDTTTGGTTYRVLDLKPSAPTASFDDVTLWVNPASLIIERLQVTDPNGNRIAIRLNDVQVNPGLPDDTFRFSAPDGTEVVDLRTSASAGE